MSKQTKTTTDHNTIRKWAEAREGTPSVVTENGNETEMIRLDFLGYSEENLQEISWDKWFQIFEKNNLLFKYQEQTQEGEQSNFNKVVSRVN